MSGSMTVVESCTAPAPEAILFPVLTYTDAQPRDDLQAINNVTAPWRVKNGKPMRWDFTRPETTDEASTRRPPPGASATFDFQLTAPPDEVIPSDTPDRSPVGPHIVGIALGSPSMLQEQEELPSPRFNTPGFASDSAEGTQPTKSNKWKKIGGLFRAKNTLALPVDHARVERRKHTLTKERPATKASKSSQPRFSTEEWPKLEIDKTANIDGHRARDFSTVVTEGPNGKPNGGPLLNVKIPNVQMERYSVMFSNVMNHQRPSLLARRSKTLDNLRIPNNQDFLAPKLPSVPRRRATSPARSSFTVFPTSQPPKAAQILGTQNVSHGPSPLLRSNTLPVESPTKSPGHYPCIFNNSSLSSFESPVISNLFSGNSDTPRSSNTYTRNEDKPLPAIKPEAVARPRKSSLQVATLKHTQQTSPRRSEQEAPKRRRPRPDLTIQTQEQAPAPPAKDKPRQPSTKAIMSGIPQTMSPVQLSDRKLPLEKHSVQIVTEREIVDSKEKSPKVPRIEVSTARSISVSKGKRQMLVPIAARVDQLGSNERFVDRRALVPRVTDAQYGHRHAVSQELQIESL